MKRKVGRRKNSIWEHAIEEGGFKCNYCKKLYTGGATRLRSHLTGNKKGGGISTCTSVPPNIAEALKSDTTTTSSLQRPSDSNTIALHLAASSSCARESTDDEANNLLPKFILENNLPGEIVEQSNFKNFISLVARPGYELPDSLDIIAENIQSVSETWSITGCTVTVHLEEVCSPSNFLVNKSDIIGYTVYSPKGVVFLPQHEPRLQDLIISAQETMKREAFHVILHGQKELEEEEGEEEEDNIPTDWLSNICISSCATEKIHQLLSIFEKSSPWVSKLLSEVKFVYKYIPTPIGSSTSIMYDHPFSELEVVMKHKTQLRSTYCNQHEDTTEVSEIINKEKFWQDGLELLHAIRPLINILHVFGGFIPNYGYFFKASKKAEAIVENCQLEKFKDLRRAFRYTVLWNKDYHIRKRTSG